MMDTVFVDYDESRVSVAEIMDAIKEAGYSG
jgi:copper chaperone CopZ